jgi:drug/metabolite transporter (DMT)-like permease
VPCASLKRYTPGNFGSDGFLYIMRAAKQRIICYTICMIIPFFVQLLYGILGPLNKQAVTAIPFTLYVGLKLSIAGCLLLAYHSLIMKKSIRLTPDQWVYYVQMILFGAIGAQLLKYWGLQYVSASKAAFLFNSSPFFVAFFSWIRWQERLHIIQWIGLCISFIGLFPIIMLSTPTHQPWGDLLYISLPELAILAAAASHAISFTAKRIVINNHNYAPAHVNGLYLLTGGIGSMVSWLGMGMPYASTSAMVVIGYAAGTTLIGKIFCSSMTLYLLRYYSATFLSFMEYWYPLCVAFWSWLFWGEMLSYHYWISAAIVLCGQLLFYWSIVLTGSQKMIQK